MWIWVSSYSTGKRQVQPTFTKAQLPSFGSRIKSLNVFVIFVIRVFVYMFTYLHYIFTKTVLSLGNHWQFTSKGECGSDSTTMDYFLSCLLFAFCPPCVFFKRTRLGPFFTFAFVPCPVYIWLARCLSLRQVFWPNWKPFLSPLVTGSFVLGPIILNWWWYNRNVKIIIIRTGQLF